MEQVGVLPTALDVDRYDLRAEYDWAQQILRARLQVTLSARVRPPNPLVLDSRVKTVRGVTLGHGDDGVALPFVADPKVGTLSIDLTGHVRPGVVFTVDYDAVPVFGPGVSGLSALTSVAARAGDPASPNRIMYTMSEPAEARFWLPSHDVPADRAFFSIEMKLGPGEKLISNGRLVHDGSSDSRPGRMHYETAYPLPTYLMAFAIGDLEAERAVGPHHLPLAIWHRKGVPGDYRGTLRQLDGAIRHFEKLIGVPYPFEGYSVVLVPDFLGGEEHAGITFQAEELCAQPEGFNDVLIEYHELAHQWFGDLVTVESWDDLWIKEGLASLLENEGTRAQLDRDGRRPSDGNRRFFQPGLPILKPAWVPPEQRYDSATYDRAAWLLSQIRATVGETTFWSTLRRMLSSHAFGTINTRQFLEAFAPALGPTKSAQVQAALTAAALPSVTVQAVAGGARVTVSDPEGTLIEPLSAEWLRADGSVETVTFRPDVPQDLVRQSTDDLLVLDPPDLHPRWWMLLADDASWQAYAQALTPLRVPSPGALPRFTTDIGGVAQTIELLEGALPTLQPSQFQSFLDQLDSDAARATAIARACAVAEREGPASPWLPLLKTVIQTEPFYIGMALAPSTYDACGRLFPPNDTFSYEWGQLGLGLPSRSVAEPQVSYLQKFSTSAATSLSVWGAVVEKGYSSRLRFSAAQLLSLFAQRGKVPAAEAATWRARFAELLDGSDVPFVQLELVNGAWGIAGMTAAENQSLLASLVKVLRTPSLGALHELSACTGFFLAAGDAAAWATFVEGLGSAPQDVVTERILQDPAGWCGFSALARTQSAPTAVSPDARWMRPDVMRKR